MKQLNKTGLREVLDRMTTEELESMLQTELDREDSDPEAVRLILRILEARHQAEPDVHNERDTGKLAWKRYQARIRKFRQSQAGGSRRWISIAASLLIVLLLAVAVIPQQAEAETFWQMLQKWSDTVLGYFNRDDRFGEMEYEFKTNHPGLQQVYDAVVELGVTEPVVPMWLPDGFELDEFKTKNTPMLKGVMANFSDGQAEIIYKLDIYVGEPAHQYYKDDTHYESYEKDGTIFNIAKNIERWVVVWSKENIECSLALDCSEDTLKMILGSINVMEDK